MRFLSFCQNGMERLNAIVIDLDAGPKSEEKRQQLWIAREKFRLKVMDHPIRNYSGGNCCLDLAGVTGVTSNRRIGRGTLGNQSLSWCDENRKTRMHSCSRNIR